MFPGTVTAVAGFVLFVAPGLVWELLRERRRPPLAGSAFREAMRVALVSVVCTALALLVLVLWKTLWPQSLPNVSEWLRRPKRYPDTHYRLIAQAAGLELILACSFAWIPHRFPRLRIFRWVREAILDNSSDVVLTPHSALWEVTMGDARPTSARGMREPLAVAARLTDGTIYQGAFKGLDTASDRDAAFLALQPPITRQRAGDSNAQAMHPGLGRLVLCMADVRDLWICHQKADPRTSAK